MSYFRSYIEKNNTIIKDSSINTAKNPATDIFYGAGFSKFIFKVDFESLIEKVNGEYVLNSETKHTLHLTNTIFGDESFKGAVKGTGSNRASSFDLILFKVPEAWDEGVGFEYERTTFDYGITKTTYSENPSNWEWADTISGWTIPGIYADSPEIIETIHFDNGDENINVDITEYVNGILSGDTDYGIGLAFSVPYQDIPLEENESVAFFSKYTQTFFEPFVESHFNDTINDDRHSFQEEVLQNLYLYVTKETNFYDLDNLPTVDIYDSRNTIVSSLSGLTTTKVREGVYKVTFGLTGLNCDGKRFYYDKWNGALIDGIDLSTITQKFIPKAFTDGYSIGENPTELKRYAVQFFGIKQNEKIARGDKRKLIVNFKSIDDKYNTLFDEVYYRLYIKEGRTQVIVHDWTIMDKTNENSVIFDTSYFIPREYFMEIKGERHSDIIHYNKDIKFEIVSER